MTPSIVARDPEADEAGVATRPIGKPMIERYEAPAGSPVQRLLGARQAAGEARGDVRGRRSAAGMVSRANTVGRPWHDMVGRSPDGSADPMAALADAPGHD